MIAFVQGRVAAVGPGSAVVDVGGVGMEVQASPGTLAELRVGEQARVATSLVVRQDSLTLYGFAEDDERTCFELVQTASGVGPRLAQAILAVLSPEQIRRAVATEDVAALTAVPGIGKKGAQRIVLELKDRLGSAASSSTPSAGGGASSVPGTDWRSQVHSGLVGLGWSSKEADGAVQSVAPIAEEAIEAGTPPNVAVLLRTALQTLSRA